MRRLTSVLLCAVLLGGLIAGCDSPKTPTYTEKPAPDAPKVDAQGLKGLANPPRAK